MRGYEQADTTLSFEQRAATFVDRYTGLLHGAAETCLQVADLVVGQHQERLDDLLDQDRRWVTEDLKLALNATNSSVGKLLNAAHSDIGDILEQGYHTALAMIPETDVRLWDAIERQSERSGLHSEEVGALLEGASSRVAASIMETAFDYPLWLFMQRQIQERGFFHPELRYYSDIASHTEAANAIDVGMDYPLWRTITAYAINDGPDYSYGASTEDSSDGRIKQAMDAGLDYQVAIAAFQRRDRYDEGYRPRKSIRSALDYATPLTRQILEERFGNRYKDIDDAMPTEKESRAYYQSIADEAAASFGEEPFTPEELLQRILNIREGRNPDDDDDIFTDDDEFGFAGSGFEDDFGGAGQESWQESSMPEPDSRTAGPYEVLGLARNASAKEIKTAFRRLAKEHHTDVGGEKGDIQEINVAYEIIGDPDRRAYFDKHGHLRGYAKPVR